MPENAFAPILEKFAVKKLPHGEVELTGDVPYEMLAPFREMALREITAEMEMPGFRKGHVPERVVLQKVGEMGLLEEAVDHFVREFYPALILEKKLEAVGRPQVRITKMTPGEPVSLTIQTAVYPKIELPKEYKKIASGIPAIVPEPVTEDEFTQALEQLRKSRAAKAEDGSEQLPELNDDFAKSVGAFQTIEEMKTKLREGIAEEKARDARDKYRGGIIEALLAKTSIDMPEIFIEGELQKMFSQMQGDVARFGLPFEEYLKRIEKTEEKLSEELKPSAEKRAKLQLMLNKIAEEEKIVADAANIEREFTHAIEHYPDADKEGLRIHIETILRNEKVLAMLEDSGKKA